MIGLNPFFLEQWDKGGFISTHPVSTQDVLAVAHLRFPDRIPGYRDGVVLVPISDRVFRSKILTLAPDQEAQVFFKSRVEGEAPRITLPSVKVQSEEELPIGCTWAVLYAHHVLAEKDEPRTVNPWDIITLLTNPTWDEVPMNPQTLMANHFGLPGGTSTTMSPEEFEASLRKSVLYWSDKAMAQVETENA